MFIMSARTVTGGICVSPPLEYYMTGSLEVTCTDITVGVEFENQIDGYVWSVHTVDADGGIIDQVTDGTPYYLMMSGTGFWGGGYMPHLYAPGYYYGDPMTWEQSWTGVYTGSEDGDISDLDDIANRNPITDYDPNLVIKTGAFASADGNNTLIVPQEQVFIGWWGGPWTEPDGEVITWTFGPFLQDSPSDFVLRILMTTRWNSDLYVSDHAFTVCSLLPARVQDATPAYFPTLTAAYQNADNGDTIQSQQIIFEEDVDMNINKSVTLEAGYDCNYTYNTGVTTISGDLAISSGTVIIQSGTFEVAG